MNLYRWRPLAFALALSVGVLGTWLQHRHQFFSGFDLFPGPRGDTRLIAYLCEHWYQTLRGHGEPLSPAMFYPVKNTLGYSDALLLFAPPYSMLRAGGVGIFTALAFTVVLFNFLNYVCCFLLLNKTLRFGVIASCVGAMFFAFNNPKLAQPDHLQLQPVFLLPLIAMMLIRVVRDGDALSRGKVFSILSLAALLFCVQMLTSFYVGWFFAFWCALFLGLCVVFRRTREILMACVRRHWRSMAGAAAVFVLGMSPFLLIYLPAVRQVGGWPYEMAVGYIPAIKSFFLMADGNYVWGRVMETFVGAHTAGSDWGRRIGIGLVPTVAWLVITGFGLRAMRKSASTNYLFLGVLILAVNLLVIIGFQVRGHSLWRFVHELFPGAKGIRAVARYAIVLALPMAIAFAWAMERVSARRSLSAVLVAIAGFGLFEQFSSGEGEYFSIRAENARLRRLAARLPGDCTAFYVTAGEDVGASEGRFRNQQLMHDAMLVSLLRGVPTLNGRSGKSPPGWSLREVNAPDYEERVARWIAQHRLDGKVCRLEIEE